MDSDGDFSLHVEQNGEGPIVTLVGDLDLLAAPVLRKCLHDHRTDGVTLDFSRVTFMDSTALGVLLAAQKRIALEGGRLTLRGVQPREMRLFTLTQAAEHLTFEAA